jgi:hypothetical protein
MPKISVIHTSNPKSGVIRDILLGYETDYYGKETSSLDKGADDDCGHTVMSCLLRLAGTGLQGSLADPTDTEGCGESSESGSDGLAQNTQGHTRLK